MIQPALSSEDLSSLVNVQNMANSYRSPWTVSPEQVMFLKPNCALFNWQTCYNTMTLVFLGSFTQSSAKGDYSFSLQHNCPISRLELPSLGTGFTFAQLSTCRSDPQEHMESNLKQQIPCCFRKLLNQVVVERREGTMQEILPFWIGFLLWADMAVFLQC